MLRKYCSSDQTFIQWFDKPENWRRQIARGTLELFPHYRVLKRDEMKGKQFVFEVNNDADTYILAAESEIVMDLWVTQLQMQTRLNPRIVGKISLKVLIKFVICIYPPIHHPGYVCVHPCDV